MNGIKEIAENLDWGMRCFYNKQSGEYRQRWFKYKDQRYIEWVKEQLDDHNRIEYIE
jgi:hypothetical protein